MTRAIGLVLVITGLVLAVWFAQTMMSGGGATVAAYGIAAIALAMLSVGGRYVFKSTRPKG